LDTSDNSFLNQINLAKIDTTEIPKFSKKYFKVEKFPALILVSNGKQSRYDAGNLAENMLAWLKRISRSAQLYSTVLYTEEDVKNFMEQNQHSTVFFGDSDTPEFEAYHSIAKKWSDSKFGHTTDSDLKLLFNITKEFGVVINNKAEPEANEQIGVYQVEANNANVRKEMQNFIVENTGISVANFEHNHYHRFARNFEVFMILFIKDENEPETREAISQLKKVGKKVKKSMPISILRKGGPDESDRIWNEEGVKEIEVPVLYIIERGENRRFKLNGKITSAKIENFVYKWKNQQLPPVLRSGPIPESSNELVKEIVHDTWDEIVLSHDKDVLVEFYAPGCHHCTELDPHYAEVAQLVKNNPNLLLGRVDSNLNEVPGIVVSKTPSFFFIKKGRKSDPIPVYGAKSAASILESLKKLVSYPWIEGEGHVELKPDEL